MHKKNVLLILVGSLGIFSIIFLIALEVPWFENTFDATGLAIRSTLPGLISGAIIAYFLTRKLADSLDKVRVSLAIIITALIVFPLAGSISNRYFSGKKVELEQVLLFKQIPYYSGRFGLPDKDNLQWTGIYIFVVRNEKIERLACKKALFLPEMVGQEVTIPVRRGFWGYDFFYMD